MPSIPAQTGNSAPAFWSGRIVSCLLVGELVRCTDGCWTVRPFERRGHKLATGRMPVSSIACSCGRYLTWRCECGAVTYGRRWLRAAKAAVAASSDAGLVVLLEPRILLGE